jgi:hypothetical protein
MRELAILIMASMVMLSALAWPTEHRPAAALLPTGPMPAVNVP